MNAAASVRGTLSRLSTPARMVPGRWLFPAWLLMVYTAWSGIVILAGLWPVVRAHWQVSVAMAGGSFIGGSSPVAGGTVGFPLLVYVFDHPAKLGRDFCLAIQSVGMVSASIFILTQRRNVEWRLLRPALLGASLGMPAGLTFLTPNVADVTVKILFSIVYASFGLMHLVRLPDIVANAGPTRTRFASDSAVGFAVGAMGGLLASVIGVGADILLYGTLVLLYHADIKVAIPTAVILMAFTSLVGLSCTSLAALWSPTARLPLAAVFPYWLAAAPVVAVGGPLGSLVSRFVPHRVVLNVVALLCLSQYALTCYHEHIVGWRLVPATLGVLAVNLALHVLFEFGRKSLPLEA